MFVGDSDDLPELASDQSSNTQSPFASFNPDAVTFTPGAFEGAGQSAWTSDFGKSKAANNTSSDGPPPGLFGQSKKQNAIAAPATASTSVFDSITTPLSQKGSVFPQDDQIKAQTFSPSTVSDFDSGAQVVPKTGPQTTFQFQAAKPVEHETSHISTMEQPKSFFPFTTSSTPQNDLAAPKTIFPKSTASEIISNTFTSSKSLRVK